MLLLAFLFGFASCYQFRFIMQFNASQGSNCLSNPAIGTYICSNRSNSICPSDLEPILCMGFHMKWQCIFNNQKYIIDNANVLCQNPETSDNQPSCCSLTYTTREVNILDQLGAGLELTLFLIGIGITVFLGFVVVGLFTGHTSWDTSQFYKKKAN